MDLPRTLIITSCTGEKRANPERPLTLDDFQNSQRRQRRERALAKYACSAGLLYTGTQHLRLMEGVHTIRRALGPQAADVAIVSAGYGLLAENESIVPYEVTFTNMTASEILSWAKHLDLHASVEAAIERYDLVFFLLGEKYLRAVSFPIDTRDDQTLVFLASRGSKKIVSPLIARSYVLSLSNAEAAKYRYGIIGLKGYLMKRFLEIAANDPSVLRGVREHPELLKRTLDDHLLPSVPQPSLFPEIMKRTTTNRLHQSPTTEFLPILQEPPAANISPDTNMLYFMPDSDDRVDPNYDFATDTHTENRDPYKDDVYAHEIYDTPNYDGILVSANKINIQRVGDATIHDYVRYNGPIMGDCGAFAYIERDEPPFDTNEIIDFYHRLGFNYGVSVDHLIVGKYAEKGIREKRFKITCENALAFLNIYNERCEKDHLTFTPIAAIQGWNPATYAEMARVVLEAGYTHIGLGGLARARTTEILEILKAIKQHLRPNTRVHLFGVARIDAIPTFRHLGVTSFDSASPLRRAWLGSGANYHTLSGKMYTAIRIPSVEGYGVRIKQLIEAGVASREQLRRLETAALSALREFDQGILDVNEALDPLLAYDELVEKPRNGQVNAKAQAKRRALHEKLYRELLQDRPWKACECIICKETGIETVIFRGNNRNRRRGFHNTYVFYKRFQKMLQMHRAQPQPW